MYSLEILGMRRLACGLQAQARLCHLAMVENDNKKVKSDKIRSNRGVLKQDKGKKKIAGGRF